MESYLLKLESGKYCSLLLNPRKNIAYLGTTTGCVEVWDLDSQEKVVELRYLVIDEFGEQVPIEDPVVNLSTPNEFDVVYAFMGQAAYCIDVELNVIIHQIPISERVVWGSVSPILGQVAILSESGYLSRWSPKFIERIGSIEFPFKISNCYITHDFDESRIIMVLDQQFIILTNLEGERYTIELEYQPAQELIGSAWFDTNADHRIFINDLGEVVVESTKSNLSILDPQSILISGILESERNIRTAISKMDTSESKRTYIQDQRLDRQSRDRYTAEVESLGKEVHFEGNQADDAKSLDFAFKEYNSENIQSQSEAMSVIYSICNRHNIKMKFALFAWKLGGISQLIDNARYYELEAYKRRKLIKNTTIISIILAFVMLISAQTIIFSGLVIILFALIVIVESVVLIYWKNINRDPTIPNIETYRAVRLACWLAIIISLYLFIVNSLSDIVDQIAESIPF